MSLLIKGMDMPRCCKVCKFSYFTVGKLMRCLFFDKVEDYVQRFSLDGERDLNCPLAEIPTSHGRLIDANEIREKMKKYGFKAPDMTVSEFIEDEITTIIEAEGK